MGKSDAYRKRNKRRREREKEENERLQRLRGIDEEERRGNVLLWDLIVNNDDICFKTYHSEIGFERCEILLRSE